MVQTGYLDIWQPATLNIKREGYSIKDSGSSAVTANEKFLPGTLVCSASLVTLSMLLRLKIKCSSMAS